MTRPIITFLAILLSLSAHISRAFTVNGGSGTVSVTVPGNGGECVLNIGGTADIPVLTNEPAWVTLTGMSNEAIVVMVDKNPANEPRKGELSLGTMDGAVRVLLTQEGSQVGYKITGMRFSDSDHDNNLVGTWGDPLYAGEVQYVKPLAYYNLMEPESQEKTFHFKYFKPSGTMMSGKSSPAGYTYSVTKTLEPGENSIRLRGWGSVEKTAYKTPGTYRVEMYEDGKLLYKSQFTIVTHEPTVFTVDGSTTSKTLDFGSDGGTKYVTVNCDLPSWDISGLPSWCTVEEKTPTSLKLKVAANTGNNRKIPTKVTCGSKTITLYLNQEGSATTQIDRVWVDHNQFQNGQKGMLIHINLLVNGRKGRSINPTAYFEYQNGTRLRDTDGSYKTTDGQVSVGDRSTATYDGTRWEDFKLFLPYNQLHITQRGKTELRFYVIVWDGNERLATSDYTYFYYTY